MMKFVWVFLVLLVPAAAVPFWHADELDYERNLDYARSNPYDAFDPADMNDFSSYNCIDLDAYNRYASRNPYDRFEEITARSPNRVLKKLRRDDFNRLAHEDPFDGLDADDADSFSDMDCWTLRDYNSFADVDRYDRWKPATLRDPEHFDRVVHNVGKKRFHFFDYRDLYDLRR